jgi:phosphoglycolate phosphatase
VEISTANGRTDGGAGWTCKAVVFDLDGTLVDSLADISAALNTVLERHGHAPHDRDACRAMVGWGLKNLVSQALPEGAKDSAALLAAELLEHYHRYPVIHSQPYAGIPELLRHLAARSIPSAVLSNKADPITQAVVARLFPSHRFRGVVGERPGIPKKPDPIGAIQLCATLGCAPQDAILLGDSEVDIETARRAGMIPVGAAWGFRGAEELIQAGAAHILHHPLELLPLLGDGHPS